VAPAPDKEDTAGSWREFVLLAGLGGTVVIVAGLDLFTLLRCAPQNWDSMACHLARVGYYFQHGSLATYPANYWAQVMHPRNHPILLLFAFLTGGENFTQFVQFLAYLMVGVCVVGIAGRLGVGRRPAALAGLLALLLVEAIMESTTTQNDLLIAAYTGVAVYSLASFRQTRGRRYLWLAALAVGLMMGVKGSAFLTFPSLALAALAALRPGPGWDGRQSFRATAELAAAGALAVGLLVLPSGYLENWRLYGHPLGPAEVRKNHTFEGCPLEEQAAESAKNVGRFAVCFLHLDGLPPVKPVRWLQAALIAGPHRLLQAVHVDLEAGMTRLPFAYERRPRCHEDFCYWGILGPALVWPLVLFGICRWRSAPLCALLATATLVFLLVQAAAGPYDPWRGRYFLWCSVFALPVVASFLPPLLRHRAGLAYLLLVLTLACLSAVCAVLFRDRRPVFTGTNWLTGRHVQSVYTTDRIGQITWARPFLAPVFRRYEETVPDGATVAVCLPGDSWEYPLFGPQLSRKLLPVGASFAPAENPAVDFLFFSETCLKPQEDDIPLGGEYYLRKLR
jgi:hypothetical protein